MNKKKKNRAYVYQIRRAGNNEHIKYAAAIVSLVAVETLLVIEYMNQCINQIINN